jgi:hypothetical protein
MKTVVSSSAGNANRNDIDKFHRWPTSRQITRFLPKRFPIISLLLEISESRAMTVNIQMFKPNGIKGTYHSIFLGNADIII